MIKLALRSALSDRAADGKVMVVDSFSFDAPKTSDAVAAIDALGLSDEGRVLIVLDHDDANAALSFRNIPNVHVLPTGELNAYDVLCCDTIVFTKNALPVAPEPKAKKKPKAKAAAATQAPAEASADEEPAAAAQDAAEEAPAAVQDAVEDTAEEE